MDWFSIHNHSKYSAKDALPSVPQMVRRAAGIGWPALGLTDHGTVAGIVSLYKESRRAQVLPLPGIEAYIAVDRNRTRQVHHMTIVATDTVGWYNLIALNNMAMDNFRYKPILDWGDLAALSSAGLLRGLWATTGCWFGFAAPAVYSTYPKAVSNIVAAAARMFEGRLLVELQNHGISDGSHDDELHAGLMHRIAEVHGLPVVATSDSHYLLEKDKPDHETLKRLSTWSDDTDDAVFPGDGYHMPTEKQMKQRFEPGIWKDCQDGLEVLLESYALKVPELDNFRLAVPSITPTPNDDLAALVAGEMPKSSRYAERAEEEMRVIRGAGMSSYILLVKRICDWMRDAGIMFAARGSASGSLVCYLLGITSVNPLRHGLRFDRFMSTDRLKPPDIDLDVDRDRRVEVLEWLNREFSTMQIGNWRALDYDFDSGRGSLAVKWQSMARKTGADPDGISLEERRSLESLARHQPYDGVGVHAAGLVVTPDDSVASRIPTQYVASSRTTVTAWDKRDVEAAGYLKIDILGSSTVTAVYMACRSAGMDIASIPNSDPSVYRRIAAGRTSSLFQFQGGAARRGSMSLKPTSFNDLVAALALFRPAVMDAGYADAYIRRKHRREVVPSYGRLVDSITEDTYGLFIYQEQVMQFLSSIGMEADDLTETLKAVKSSNADTAGAARHMRDTVSKVRELAKRNGVDPDGIDHAVAALRGYGEYGFNKAHAVAYARMAFITAWLAVHRPVHWWAAVLTVWDGTDNHQRHLKTARADGITVLRPHINRSGSTWTPSKDRHAVSMSLSSVDGVGTAAAQEIHDNAPYSSIDDLVERTNSRIVTGAVQWRRHHSTMQLNGVLGKLYEAGCLEGLLEGE